MAKDNVTQVGLELAIDDFVKNLKSLPGMTDAEAKKIANSFRKGFGEAEKASEKARQRMEKEFETAYSKIGKGAEKLGKSFGGPIGAATDLFVDFSETVGSSSAAIGGLGVAAAGSAALVAGLAVVSKMVADEALVAAKRLEEQGLASALPDGALESLKEYEYSQGLMKAQTDVLVATLGSELAPILTEITFATIGLINTFESVSDAISSADAYISYLIESMMLFGATSNNTLMILYGLAEGVSYFADKGNSAANTIKELTDNQKAHNDALAERNRLQKEADEEAAFEKDHYQQLGMTDTPESERDAERKIQEAERKKQEAQAKNLARLQEIERVWDAIGDSSSEANSTILDDYGKVDQKLQEQLEALLKLREEAKGNSEQLAAIAATEVAWHDWATREKLKIDKDHLKETTKLKEEEAKKAAKIQEELSELSKDTDSLERKLIEGRAEYISDFIQNQLIDPINEAFSVSMDIVDQVADAKFAKLQEEAAIYRKNHEERIRLDQDAATRQINWLEEAGAISAMEAEKRRIQAEKEADEKQKALDAEMKAKQEAALKSFNLSKSARIAQVGVDTAAAIVSLLIGYGPSGPLAPGLAAATAIASGAAAIAAISSEKPPEFPTGLSPDHSRVVAIQPNEAILNSRATRQLGADTIRSLNNGIGATPMNLTLSLDRKTFGYVVADTLNLNGRNRVRSVAGLGQRRKRG